MFVVVEVIIDVGEAIVVDKKTDELLRLADTAEVIIVVSTVGVTVT